MDLGRWSPESICLALSQGATAVHHIDCHDVILRWKGKELHETFSPMFPAQASLSQVPSWRKVGRQIHEAPSAPLQFVSLMKTPVFRTLQHRSRAFSFDGRKPGDERPNALMLLKTAAPGHSLQRGPICYCKYWLAPITGSAAQCSCSPGGGMADAISVSKDRSQSHSTGQHDVYFRNSLMPGDGGLQK